MAWKSAAGRSAIGKLLRLMGEDKPFYRGSPVCLPDEHTPVKSKDAGDLVSRCVRHSPDNPLYVVEIGSINQRGFRHADGACYMRSDDSGAAEWSRLVTREFNMRQDVGAARVAFSVAKRLAQPPGRGESSGCAGVLASGEIRTWRLSGGCRHGRSGSLCRRETLEQSYWGCGGCCMAAQWPCEDAGCQGRTAARAWPTIISMIFHALPCL